MKSVAQEPDLVRPILERYIRKSMKNGRGCALVGPMVKVPCRVQEWKSRNGRERRSSRYNSVIAKEDS